MIIYMPHIGKMYDRCLHIVVLSCPTQQKPRSTVIEWGFRNLSERLLDRCFHGHTIQKSRCPRGGRGAGNGIEMASLGRKKGARPSYMRKKGGNQTPGPGIGSQASETKYQKPSWPRGALSRRGRRKKRPAKPGIWTRSRRRLNRRHIPRLTGRRRACERRDGPGSKNGPKQRPRCTRGSCR